MTAPDPAWLAARAQASTTMARCWRLQRRDGLVLGFTDHDRDLVFGGTTYRAGAALTASEAAASLGLSADDMEAAGALQADTITEADIARGLYDGAAVELWEADWTDPPKRQLIARFEVGSVRRGAVAFTAELRSATARLELATGRHLGPCDATLGDARCGVNLAPGSPFRGTGTVAAGSVSADRRAFRAAGLGGFASGLFARGVLTWTSGANAGAVHDVRGHGLAAGVVSLELWRAPAFTVAAGDAFAVTAGCDKTLATCRDRFANAANHRGFPSLPREDFAARYASRGDEGLDGGAL